MSSYSPEPQSRRRRKNERVDDDDDDDDIASGSSPAAASASTAHAPARQPASYRRTALFTGRKDRDAIVVDLPTNFADVSKLRQVPDNQEVFIDKDGFTSIIFEITERVGAKAASGVEADGAALVTHLEDLVGSDIDTVKAWSSTETRLSKHDSIPAYTVLATQTPPVADSAAKVSSAPDFTAIILTLLRLERESTDVLITINVPHIKGEYDEDDVDLQLGKQGQLIGDAVEYCDRIWKTFEIKDWDLFNEV